MPNSGFSWGAKLSDIADAVWTRSERKLTNLDDARASKIDNLDVAISSRATNEGVWEYPTRGLTEAVDNVIILPSDEVKAEANTERTTTSTNYVKLKEFKVFATGTIRLKWEFRTSSGSYSAQTRVYKNGVGTAAEFETYSTTYVAKTCEIDVNEGDIVQLYGRINGSGYTCYIRNAKLCYTVNGGGAENPLVIVD